MDFDTKQEKLKDMQGWIEGYGNDHTWYMIENLYSVQERVAYRALFFEVGGRVPEKELIL